MYIVIHTQFEIHQSACMHIIYCMYQSPLTTTTLGYSSQGPQSRVVPRKVLGGRILHAGGTVGEEQSLLDRLLNLDVFGIGASSVVEKNVGKLWD